MNIKFIEILKQWIYISQKHNSFSEYIDTMANSKKIILKSTKKLNHWFTTSSFFSYAFSCLIPNSFVIACIVTIANFFFDFSLYQNTTTSILAVIFSILLGFFILTPIQLKNEIQEHKNITQDFEDKIANFVKNNENISQFLPEFKAYCTVVNKEDFFKEFMFRTINDSILFTDVIVIFEFLNHYFNQNVNVDNYNDIVQASNELKGVNYNQNNNQANIEFFKAT